MGKNSVLIKLKMNYNRYFVLLGSISLARLSLASVGSLRIEKRCKAEGDSR